MSKRGMFGPGRGRGGRGGSQNLSREWNSMNCGDSGQAFNNYMPPPQNMAAANRNSATPFNITVTVNPSENYSHYSQPGNPFQNEAPFQQHYNNPDYPLRGGFSVHNYDSPPNLPPSRFCGPSDQRQSRDARNRQDLPPPYAEVPPASAGLSHGDQNKAPERGGFHNQARGLRSRMRGKKCKSCGNLAASSSSHYKDVGERESDCIEGHNPHQASSTKSSRSSPDRRYNNNNSRGTSGKPGFHRSTRTAKSCQRDSRNSPRTKSPVEKPKEVNATLVFKTGFETASILANLIESTIVFPERKGYEICFDQTTLKHKENTAICQFTVYGPSIEIAKQCVNKLKNVLRQKLKATIYLNFSSANGEPSACDDVDGKSESRKDKPFKNDSPENKVHVKDKDGVDYKKNKKIQHYSEASPKNDGDKNEYTKEGCSPIPTTILFSVEERYSSPIKLVSFLKSVTSKLPFEIEIINGSISLSTQTSKCSIKTESKANARRLIQAFDDLTKETQLNITCTTSKFEDKSKSK